MDSNDINTDLTNEADLSLREEQEFRSYWEESFIVFDYLQTRLSEEMSNEEKVYLYEYNRNKINPGCIKVLSILKKRRDYF